MKSFLQGKKTLSIPPLRPTVAPALASATPAAKPAAKHHEPHAGQSSAQVEVVKEGDKVVRLVVTCSCGERIEIECLYAGGT